MIYASLGRTWFGLWSSEDAKQSKSVKIKFHHNMDVRKQAHRKKNQRYQIKES